MSKSQIATLMLLPLRPFHIQSERKQRLQLYNLDLIPENGFIKIRKDSLESL